MTEKFLLFFSNFGILRLQDKGVRKMIVKQMQKQVLLLTQSIILLEHVYRKELQAGSDIAKDLKLSLDRTYDERRRILKLIHSI